MVSKCANQNCNSTFRYLGKGRLFRFERALPSPADPEMDGITNMRKMPSSVEHFWLCEHCAAHMTLTLDVNKRVVAVPVRPFTRFAVAS